MPNQGSMTETESVSLTTVLVVDDDESTRMILQAILNQHQCETLLAADGAEGWEVFRQHAVDVVLCDWQMPNMDGLELMAKIKERDPLMPVIVVSGQAGMQQVVEALRLGADDYLNKPWGAAGVVWHAVEQALHRRQLIREKQLAEERLREAYHTLSEKMNELKADQSAAASVQVCMLPQRHYSLAGYDIAFEWQPMLDVSGDFIEYFPINQHHLGFFLADVSGHGTSSGLVTVLLKSITNRLKHGFDEQAQAAILDPTQWFHAINEELLSSGLGKHVAMFAGVINLDSGHLAYSGAAHMPAAYIVHSDGLEALPGHGLPVGVVPSAKWELRHSQLPVGGRLVVMTDGILEVMPDESVVASEQRVERIVKASAGEISALKIQLEPWAELDPLDDLSILTIHRREGMGLGI